MPAGPSPKRPAACRPGDIGIIVLNHDGLPHLSAGLPSLLALEGLAGPEAVLVADNGSRDGSLGWLAATHPGLRRLDLGRNWGFAEGNNRAAAAFVEAPWLLFLNNDTRVHPQLLQALAAAAADPDAGPLACYGARLLDWEGERIDFDGGAASLTGHGHALGVGRRPSFADAAARPTLFACGAALLIRREAFLGLGGFSAEHFAYYEDVDLGWRLWLAGGSVHQVPAALVRHRHHGTAAALGETRRARLHERNALLNLLRNLGEEALEAVLPAALALAALRAAVRPWPAARDLLRAASELDPRAGLPLPRSGWEGWAPLASLDLDWPALAAGRAPVQALRRRPDAAVLPRLGLPYAPVPGSARAEAWLREAVDRFGLERYFGAPPPTGWRARLWRGWAALRAAEARP